MIRRMTSRAALAAALTAALGSAIAGCGSSAKPTAAAPADSSTAGPSVSSTVPSPVLPSSTAPDPKPDGDDAYCKGPGPGNPALALATATTGGADVAKLKADINQSLANAPAAIKADLQTVADVELPILDGQVSQGDIEAKIADPAFQGALRNIAAWSQAHCSGG